MAAAHAPTAWPAKLVRDTFVKFFVESCQHVNVKSSPVVPHEDPTLLFTNAGMNQFKSIFLGQADPAGPFANMKRAANSQKCIRAGGKHNDLDDVGKDTYHHTFFEMLGNWSFGDYFKEEAITWAWKLLTEVYGLPPDRLYATYFEGDAEFGLEPDTEARNIWLKFLPANRILPFNKKANFWEMGDTGPCGPCSEIHFDRIGGRDASSMVNYDDPTVIEIWNIVFMAYNREPDGSLRELPAKHIDTGMGFERLTSILQAKMSNYDTDIFQPLFSAIQEVTGVAQPYAGKLGAEDANGVDMAYRVIADHIRTLTFAITDGAVPSNTGRGYVLRRILRRAVRYGEFLSAPPGFFSKLVPVVVTHFSDAFPELLDKQNFVSETLREEEAAFNRTLKKGDKYFREKAEAIKASGGSTVPASTAFFLYESMGFPLDLTQIIASERGMTVDVNGFYAELEKQKEKSRSAGKFARTHDKLVLEAEETAFLQKVGVQPTDDSRKYEWSAEPSVVVRAVYTKDGFLDGGAAPKPGTTIGVVLDATPFYAESGGQVADTGTLVLLSANGARTGTCVAVVDVQVFGGFVLHVGTVQEAGDAPSVADPPLTVGARAVALVDYDRRGRIAPNHTMTHVLNFALRKVLGKEVDQKGSTVEEDRLRFDYSISKQPTPEQLRQVEQIVSDIIDKALPVYSDVVPLAKAKSLHTLRAVFGETYPDPVRVISVGQPVADLLVDPENPKWMALSVELCGGTHLQNTSQAARFAITEESSISKGVRRIIALTRDPALAAHDAAAELETRLSSAKSLSGAALEQEGEALKEALNVAVIPQWKKTLLREELAVLNKKAIAEKKAAAKVVEGLAKAAALAAVEAARAAGGRVVVAELPTGGDGSYTKELVTAIQAAAPDVAFLGLSTDAASKVLAFGLVPDAGIKAGLKASEWVATVLAVAGGKSGGKDNMATGSGPDFAQLPAMLDAARSFAAGKY